MLPPSPGPAFQDGSRAPLPPGALAEGRAAAQGASLAFRLPRGLEAGSGRPPACALRLSGRGGTPGPFRGWARAPPRSGGRSAVSTPVSPPGPAGRRPSPGGRAGNSQPAGVGRRIPGPDRDGPSRAGGGTMFSLKPPRPTFRSYLLPPPQVNSRLPAAPSPRVSGEPSTGRPRRLPRPPSPGPRRGEAAFPGTPPARWKLAKLRRSRSRLRDGTPGSDRSWDLFSPSPGDGPRRDRRQDRIACGHLVEGVTYLS